jgi:hypothetical protein
MNPKLEQQISIGRVSFWAYTDLVVGERPREAAAASSIAGQSYLGGLRGVAKAPEGPTKKVGSMGGRAGTAQPIPLWRLRSGPRSSPIDQCSDIAPRTSRTFSTLTSH